MFAQRLTYLRAAATALKDMTVQLWNNSLKKHFPLRGKKNNGST